MGFSLTFPYTTQSPSEQQTTGYEKTTVATIHIEQKTSDEKTFY